MSDLSPKLESSSPGTMFLEIERKYSFNPKDWNSFVSLCKSKKPIEELIVSGPDTYYENSDNKILRWRTSRDLSQLTIKSRYSKRSSLIREEVEVEIEQNSPKNTIKFITSLGFRKLFRIKKDCHIFWFKTELGEASVVIYNVSCKERKNRVFVEIEAEKGQDYADSKGLIQYWEKELNINVNRRLNKTLLELYSEKETQLIDSDNE